MQNAAMRLAVLLVALAGCASRPAAIPATESEKKQAFATYMTCLSQRVPAIDDRVSDAATIAHALRGSCSLDWLTVEDALTRTFGNGEKQQFQNGSAAMQAEIALTVVLQVRAAARK